MRYLTTILFWIVFSSCFSQLPFIGENKLWSDVKYDATFGYPFVSKFVHFKGDTTIEETEYSKVFKSEDAEMMNWLLTGFIRETDSGSVFYRSNGHDEDILLYDFGVEEGDSIFTKYGDKLFVDSIRSIPFGIYQELRNHYYLTLGPGSLVVDFWIEGVGSSMGVLIDPSTAVQIGAYRELLCFTENDSLKFMNENYNTCYYNTVGIEENQGSTIEVSFYSGQLEITLPPSNTEKYRLMLFDLGGRKVLEELLYPDESISLDVSGLAKGIYIYQISNPDLIISDKILIR